MKILISFLFTTILINLIAFGAGATSNESLVLYLTFDDEKTIAKDYSQYGNDGVVEGDPTQVEGKFGKALELNGSTDYVWIPKSDSLNFGKGSFTVEAWVNLSAEKETGNPGSRLINDRGTGAGGTLNGWQVKINNMGPGGEWGFNDSGVDDATGNYGVYNAGWQVTNAAYDNGEWYHVGVVYKAGTGLAFYVNGELDGEAEVGNYGSIDNDLPVCIGAAIAHDGNEGTKGQYFPGIVDELRLWKVALSQDELKANINKGSKLFTAVSALGKLTATWGAIKAD